MVESDTFNKIVVSKHSRNGSVTKRSSHTTSFVLIASVSD